MMHRITRLALLIGLAVAAAPVMASAQCIEITPESWDYGDVKVGSSESQIWTLHSCGTSPVEVFFIGIYNDATGAFSIISIPDVPFPIYPGESIDVEVNFTPPGPGVHEAILYIRHDDGNIGGEASIDLLGVGVRGWRCFAIKAAP
jgi:hypothetical protein